MERLAALVREHSGVKVVLDSAAGADALGRTLEAAQLSIDVLIDVAGNERRRGAVVRVSLQRQDLLGAEACSRRVRG